MMINPSKKRVLGVALKLVENWEKIKSQLSSNKLILRRGWITLDHLDRPLKVLLGEDLMKMILNL